MSLYTRFRNSWNAFIGRDAKSGVSNAFQDLGRAYAFRPDRVRFSGGNERTIVTAIYNRIAMDVAAIKIEHVDTDENGKYISTHKSCLNDCLNLSANLDQTGRAFVQEVVMEMLNSGCVCIVPVRATANPDYTESYDVTELRVGQILEWYPKSVRVRVYDEETGEKRDIIRPKTSVAIIENPLYSVINDRASIVQRLTRKLNVLDAVDEETSSGKLNMIIQLPYVIKTDARRKQAEQRRNDIDKQLRGSKLGIAYTDGTEKIVQLNRPLENNLMTQIEYLTKMAYSQLGLTQEIMDGSAPDAVMTNYYSRTIEPIISSIVDEIKRKFISQTAITQGQSIMFFRDPFKLLPVSQFADIGDKMKRNTIMTSNELRQKIGMKPYDDPEADRLENPNISKSNDQLKMEMVKDGKISSDETGDNNTSKPTPERTKSLNILSDIVNGV